MKFQVLILIPCLIGIITCISIENFKKGSIDKSARLGRHTRLARGVVIKANVIIGDYVRINRNTLIEEDSKVGRYSRLGKDCTLKERVTLLEDVRLGDRTIVEPESFLKSYSRIASDVKIGNRVTVNKYTRVGKSVELGDDSVLDRYVKIDSLAKIQSKAYVGYYGYVGEEATVGDQAILDDYSKIGSAVDVQPKAYVGMYSKIGDDATLGELAVIHKHVRIPKDRTVEKGEVVIQTPSSLYLYWNCAETVSDEQAEIAKPKEDGSVSPEFTNLMRQLLDEEMATLSKNCAEANEVLKPKTLPQLMSLYLIQYHGLDKFKEYVRQVKHGLDNENGSTYCSTSSLLRKLRNEFHFGEDSQRDILEANVKKTFIQLLAIDQDADRKYRVEGDTFCTMFNQLQTEERKLTLSERSKLHDFC